MDYNGTARGPRIPVVQVGIIASLSSNFSNPVKLAGHGDCYVNGFNLGAPEEEPYWEIAAFDQTFLLLNATLFFSKHRRAGCDHLITGWWAGSFFYAG